MAKRNKKMNCVQRVSCALALLAMHLSACSAVPLANVPTWTHEAFMKAVVANKNDNFGLSVSIDGDRAIAGARSEKSAVGGVVMRPVSTDPALVDNTASDSGAAFVFERDLVSGDWTNTAFLKAPLAGADDYFGYSVAISGDRAIVGAYGEDSGVGGVVMRPVSTDPALVGDSAPESGAAFIFERDPASGDWTNTAFLKAPVPGSGDQFGYSVAISGDRAIVGADGEDSAIGGVVVRPVSTDPALVDNNASGSGAGFIFERDPASGDWANTAFLKAPLAGRHDRFGTSVAISGDRAVVGAPGERLAIVFERDLAPGNWILKAPLAGSAYQFGISVAISGERAIVGADGDGSAIGGVVMHPVATDPALVDNNASFSGAAFIFEHDPVSGNWTNTAFLKAPLAEAHDYFGCSVAISGDHAIVGALLEDSAVGGVVMRPLSTDPALVDNNASRSAGAAYIFERDPVSGNWTNTAFLKAPLAEAYDLFGRFVAISGDRAIVGAYGEDSAIGGVVMQPLSTDFALRDNTAYSSGAAYILCFNDARETTSPSTVAPSSSSLYSSTSSLPATTSPSSGLPLSSSFLSSSSSRPSSPPPLQVSSAGDSGSDVSTVVGISAVGACFVLVCFPSMTK